MTILKRSASMVSALVMMISSAGAYNCSAEGTTVNDSNTNNTREIVIDGTTAQLKRKYALQRGRHGECKQLIKASVGLQG